MLHYFEKKKFDDDTNIKNIKGYMKVKLSKSDNNEMNKTLHNLHLSKTITITNYNLKS